MMLLVTVVLGLVTYLVYRRLVKANNYWKDRGVPFVPGSVLFGNFYNVIFKKRNWPETAFDIYNALEGHKFGGYMQIIEPVFMVRDPDLINTFLFKDFASFHDRTRPSLEDHDLMSAALINMRGERWLKLRSMLSSIYSPGKLKKMVNQISKITDDIIDYIDMLPKGEALEVRDLMFRLSVNIILLVSFGVKVDMRRKDEGRNKILIEMSERFFKPSFIQCFKIYVRLIWPKLSEVLGLRTTDREMDQFFAKLISDSVKYRQESGTRHDDLLQLMLDIRTSQSKTKTGRIDQPEQFQAEDTLLTEQLTHFPTVKPRHDIELTESLMTAQAFGFISAGGSAMNITLSFLLFEIAANQQVQTKLQNEIDTILSKRNFGYEAMKQMTFLDHVVNETARMHSQPILIRFCNKTYRVPDTGIVLEKGMQINIPVAAMHRDPKYFPDPDQFKPERFEKEIPKNVYWPFGGGPRMCFGKQLGILAIKIIVIRLMTKYSLKLSNKTQVPLKFSKDAIIDHVDGGIWLHFEKRSQQVNSP